MKIAVCYRGFLRTISQTFQNHKEKILKDHDVDFFVHTWDKYPEEIDFVKNIIDPKRFLIEETKSLEINPYNSLQFNSNKFEAIFDKNKRLSDGRLHSRPYNTLSMLYSLMMVNSLRKEYSKDYDLVISVRPDIVFYDNLNLNDVQPHKLNISWFENIGDHLDHPDSIIDHIAIGGQDVMNNYSDCFLYTPSYYSNLGVYFVPEILLGFHMKTACKTEVNMLNTRHSVIRIKNYNHLDNLEK
jgi:hypothetical protein